VQLLTSPKPAGAANAAPTQDQPINLVSRFVRHLFIQDAKVELELMQDTLQNVLTAEAHALLNAPAQTPLSVTAPVSGCLVHELVLQLTTACLSQRLPTLSVPKDRLPDFGIVSWYSELFLRVIQRLQASPATAKAARALSSVLFAQNVMDMLLTRVLMTMDSTVFPLIAIMSRVVALVDGVKVSADSVASMNRSLERTYNVRRHYQSGNRLTATLCCL
jgi:hypothetical protein